MNNRRSLADALATDPKKLEFIHGGKLNREISPPAEAKEVAAAKPQPKPEPVQQPEEPQAAVAEAPQAEVKLKEAVEVETEDDASAGEETARRTQPRKSRDKGRGTAAEPKPAAPTLTQAVVPFTVQIRSSDGFGTFFFHDLEICRHENGIAIEFTRHTPNKYWEGHYGLATFIQALCKQVECAENFEVVHVDLEDDWKEITIRRVLCEGDRLSSAIDAAAQEVASLLKQAEIALGGMVWKAEYGSNESLFCKEVLMPLLRRMGFLFVRYTHGRREYGKDFTFSENSPFGGLRHYGLQAKAGDVGGGVNSQVDELVGQVEDAFSMPYYELGTSDRRYISTFVIAISGHFTENAREKIVEKIPSNLLGSVWFLDRSRIDELIERHWSGSR